jgi:hypothetical protein
LTYEDTQNGILYYWIYDRDDINSLSSRLLNSYPVADDSVWVVTKSVKIERENYESVNEFLCIKKSKDDAISFIKKSIAHLENNGMILTNYISEENLKDTYTEISIGLNSNGSFTFINHTAKEYKL